MNKVIIICGPTASGKTQLGHLIAQSNKGEILNADSMQLYKNLSIITASPGAELKSELSYHLYNFLELQQKFSVAKYAQIAAGKIKDVVARGKMPIVVGGSGMYINALIEGLSEIPTIDDAIRDKVRKLQGSLSSEHFFSLLQKIDPYATNFHPQDKQRIARAYEVYLQTGKSISFYQQFKIKLLENFIFEIFMLLPKRDLLYSMCNNRVNWMFKHGAIEEVKELIKLNNFFNITKWKNDNQKNQPSFDGTSTFDLNDTKMVKALGVYEIISYLKGEISKTEALELMQVKTRQYAKRQVTWFNNQIKNKVILRFDSLKEYNDRVTDNFCKSYEK